MARCPYCAGESDPRKTSQYSFKCSRCRRRWQLPRESTGRTENSNA